jgi:hypothetical protein
MVFEVLTTVKMSLLVCWVVMPYEIIGRYQDFGETYYLQHAGISLKVHITGITTK